MVCCRLFDDHGDLGCWFTHHLGGADHRRIDFHILMYVGNKYGNDDPQLTFPVPVWMFCLLYFQGHRLKKWSMTIQKGSPVTKVHFAWTNAGLAGVWKKSPGDSIWKQDFWRWSGRHRSKLISPCVNDGCYNDKIFFNSKRLFWLSWADKEYMNHTCTKTGSQNRSCGIPSKRLSSKARKGW